MFVLANKNKIVGLLWGNEKDLLKKKSGKKMRPVQLSYHQELHMKHSTQAKVNMSNENYNYWNMILLTVNCLLGRCLNVKMKRLLSANKGKTDKLCTAQDKLKSTGIDKLVVDVARDAQCCVHTRDSSCHGQTHRWTDGWTDTVRQ